MLDLASVGINFFQMLRRYLLAISTIDGAPTQVTYSIVKERAALEQLRPSSMTGSQFRVNRQSLADNPESVSLLSARTRIIRCPPFSSTPRVELFSVGWRFALKRRRAFYASSPGCQHRQEIIRGAIESSLDFRLQRTPWQPVVFRLAAHAQRPPETIGRDLPHVARPP